MKTISALTLAGLVALSATIFAAGPAAADCRHDGKTYPEGTKLGGLTCQNGSWR